MNIILGVVLNTVAGMVSGTIGGIAAKYTKDCWDYILSGKSKGTLASRPRGKQTRKLNSGKFI